MSAIDDNRIDRLRHQYEMEDLSKSPVGEIVARIVCMLPGASKVGADLLVKHLDSQNQVRRELLLQVVADETVKNAAELDRLYQTIDEHLKRTKMEVIIDLTLDAVRKAQETRAKDRVERIALILFNGAMIEPTVPDADELEEMMRIAMNLTDNDVRHLKALVHIQRNLLQGHDHISRYDAHESYRNGPWADKIIPETDSIFLKLESYGLVSRIAPSNNQNVMADIQNRYALLPKGLRFVNLIKSRAEAAKS
jgi:hypothetical protein